MASVSREGSETRLSRSKEMETRVEEYRKYMRETMMPMIKAWVEKEESTSERQFMERLINGWKMLIYKQKPRFDKTKCQLWFSLQDYKKLKPRFFAKHNAENSMRFTWGRKGTAERHFAWSISEFLEHSCEEVRLFGHVPSEEELALECQQFQSVVGNHSTVKSVLFVASHARRSLSLLLLTALENYVFDSIGENIELYDPKFLIDNIEYIATVVLDGHGSMCSLDSFHNKKETAPEPMVCSSLQDLRDRVSYTTFSPIGESTQGHQRQPKFDIDEALQENEDNGEYDILYDDAKHRSKVNLQSKLLDKFDVYGPIGEGYKDGQLEYDMTFWFCKAFLFRESPTPIPTQETVERGIHEFMTYYGPRRAPVAAGFPSPFRTGSIPCNNKTFTFYEKAFNTGIWLIDITEKITYATGKIEYRKIHLPKDRLTVDFAKRRLMKQQSHTVKRMDAEERRENDPYAVVLTNEAKLRNIYRNFYLNNKKQLLKFLYDNADKATTREDHRYPVKEMTRQSDLRQKLRKGILLTNDEIAEYQRIQPRCFVLNLLDLFYEYYRYDDHDSLYYYFDQEFFDAYPFLKGDSHTPPLVAPTQPSTTSTDSNEEPVFELKLHDVLGMLSSKLKTKARMSFRFDYVNVIDLTCNNIEAAKSNLDAQKALYNQFPSTQVDTFGGGHSAATARPYPRLRHTRRRPVRRRLPSPPQKGV